MFDTMPDQTVYTAFKLSDPSDTFAIQSKFYLLAQVEVLKKVGFIVEPHMPVDGVVDLVDMDTNEVVMVSTGTTVAQVLDQFLQYVGWTIDDPVELIGGHIGSGFSVSSQPT